MPTINQWCEKILALGTSEGATEGWQHRARSGEVRRHEDEPNRTQVNYEDKGPGGEERRAWGFPRRREDSPHQVGHSDVKRPLFSSGTSEGAEKGWDARGRKMAKTLGLPQAGATTYGGQYRWTKHGGYYDKMRDIHDKAKANGFTPVDKEKKQWIAQPDTVGHGNVFTHPDGWELRTDQSYGATKYDNWHSITLKKTK